MTESRRTSIEEARAGRRRNRRRLDPLRPRAGSMKRCFTSKTDLRGMGRARDEERFAQLEI